MPAGGWLIFATPPAELAIHPEAGPGAALYLVTDDPAAEIAELGARGVVCSEVEQARWGLVTKIGLPGGGKVGLYQPRHPTALNR